MLAVPGTHAFVVQIIKPIEVGEEITLKYDRDGYPNGPCRGACCTGRLSNLLSDQKKSIHAGEKTQSLEIPQQKKGKKTRRGGGNHRRRVVLKEYYNRGTKPLLSVLIARP